MKTKSYKITDELTLSWMEKIQKNKKEIKKS